MTRDVVNRFNLNRDDLMIFLRAILIASFFVISAAAFAGERSAEKPSAWFCWMARGALAEAGGNEALAEREARARGASPATIAKAKRCPR